MKYSGKIIRATPPSTTTGYGANGTAGGMWTATEALQKKAAGVWPKAPQTPGAPTITNVAAGNAQAIITFTAPEDTGGLSITEYTVTSSPGDITASGSASPITVTGLTNGTSYTFTIRASNNKGLGIASSASSNVTPLGTRIIEFLMVGGGGGGGSGTDSRIGSGGAGGLVYSSAFELSLGNQYNIIIGSGGAGGNANGDDGNTGSDTTAFNLIAAGGGGGGGGPRGVACGSGGAGKNGGCGGGGVGFSSYCSGGTSTQSSLNSSYLGSITQLGYNASTTSGGGGVGAGLGGQPGPVDRPHGTSTYSSLLADAGAGENISGTYYIGGGGGSEAITGGLGGYGGGGTSGTKEGGTINRYGSAGATNMGAGGGSFGSGNTGEVPAAYSGGSGILIIRYSDSLSSAASTTGSPAETTSGGYRYYKFTGSGSITF